MKYKRSLKSKFFYELLIIYFHVDDFPFYYSFLDLECVVIVCRNNILDRC